MTRILGIAMLAGLLAAAPAAAQDEPAWTLSPADSRIAYGSIKSNAVGEVNRFTDVAGHVAADGAVTVEIDVTSVDTGIGIRDERMVEHVFDPGRPTATLRTDVDMAALEALAPGETAVVEIDGRLTLSGVEVPVRAAMFVARLTETRVLVATDTMIMQPTALLEITEGLDTLRELVDLPSIVRVVPVTLRLVFDAA